MGSKTSSQQQQASSTSADPQAVQDYNQTINRAKSVSNTPYSAYTGELTAPVNGQETTATNALNGLGATANSYFGSAAQQSGLGAAAVNPGAVDAAAIQQYESPYQSQVINSTEAELNQQDAIQQQQQTSNAIGAGAFGGDRAGIASAALAGQQDLANNATIANLNNTNYSQALGEANTQQATNLSASQANRSALQTNAQTLAGIGSAATTAGLGVANSQLGAGALQQQTQQASDTANYGQFEQAQAYPFQTEQYLANIVEGIGPEYGSSSTGTTTTQTSPLNSILGAGIGAAALAPGASSLGSGISSLFSLSDRRAKEGIQKIGKAFDGQAIYAFRYKGDPHGKVHLGLIAQEVEKKHPDAVGTLGDLKMVDYAEATRKAASKGHFAAGGRTLSDLTLHRLSRDEVEHLDEFRQRRASGGSVSTIGLTPYSDAVGYVPSTGAGTSSHMLSSPLPNSSQPTNPIPSFTQFSQAGQGLGALASGAGNIASGVGQAANFMSTPNVINFADGGKVIGLAAARTRRGYDGGGVVSPDDLLFDPDALGSPAAMQPGVGAVPDPTTFAPPTGVVPPAQPQAAPPSPAAQPSPAPAPAQQGLGPATNNNTPVPVAPAPVTTPIVGYQQPNGTVTPAQSPAGTPPVAASPAGLGAASSATNAPDAINSATLPRSVRNNNPGNIVDGTYAQGLPGYAGSDGRFAVFKTPDAGSAAMDGLLSNYGAKGLNTPLAIVSKWAPAGDGNNNPAAYAASVAKQLGIGINDPIDMNNPQQRGALAKAMAGVEAGTGGGQGSVPSSALGYAGSNAASGVGGLGAAAMPPSGSGSATLGDIGMPPIGNNSSGKGLAGVLGFGNGGNGGLLGLSDSARMGLLGVAAGMMASPSKSVGIALGQGAEQGLKTYGAFADQQRQNALARVQAANTASEIATRQGSLGLQGRQVDIAGQELQAHLQQIRQEGANYSSEDAYRKGLVGNEATRVALERYQLFPGPDGSFRYLDKANPGRGLLTAAQIPELAAAAGPANGSGGGGVSTSVGAPAASGTPPAAGISAPSGAAVPSSQPLSLNGPSALKPDAFLKTGRPTLATPNGYLPTNWWGTNLRMQSDPVAREAAAAQTKEDTTNAAVAAQKANTALYYGDEMDRNMDTLAKSGLLQPGAAFPERLNLAKSYNLAAGSLGLPTVDERSMTAGQSMIKDQTRLASQLTSSLGSREAASVFSSMMAATPGASNTAGGYKGLSSSIRVLAQRDIDRNAFVQDYQSRYGSTGEADVAFNALNPPMMYARHAQAIANVPQAATDLLRQNANDPRAIAAFERTYGAGTSRYFTGAM